MEIIPLIASTILVGAIVSKNYLKFRHATPTSFSILFSGTLFIAYPASIILSSPQGTEFYLHPPQSLSQHYLTANLLILFFYASFFLGNNLSVKKIQFLPRKKIDKKKIDRIIILSAAIGIGATIAFMILAGGLEYVASNISQIRSGRDENKTYLGAFIRLFSSFLLLALFAATYNFFDKKQPPKKPIGIRINSIKLFIFFLLTIAIKFLEGGRGGLISILMGFIFIYMIASQRLPPIKYLLATAAIAIFVIIYGKIFLFQIFSDPSLTIPNQTKNYIESFHKDFSYAYQSLLVTLENNLFGIRLYSDFFRWTLKPLKLMGYSPPESISFYNTDQLIGIYESDIPPAIVAFLIQQGGLLALILGGFLTGVVYQFIDNIVNPRGEYCGTALIASLYAILTFLSPRIIINADPAIIIMTFIPFIGMSLFIKYQVNLKGKIIN